MKNFKLILLMFLIFIISMAFTTFTRTNIEVPITPPTVSSITLLKPLPTPIPYKLIIKNHSTFLEDLGFRESSGNYKAVNPYGYLGKYQFGRKTLNNIGMKDISNQQFLSSPELQEEAMQRLMISNYKSLRRLINKYQNTVVHGVLITKSGVLAAAHLGGAGNVKKWFRRGIVFKDGNGTKITSYMKKFGGYKLDI